MASEKKRFYYPLDGMFGSTKKETSGSFGIRRADGSGGKGNILYFYSPKLQGAPGSRIQTELGVWSGCGWHGEDRGLSLHL